jgi:hypothetical protein
MKTIFKEKAWVTFSNSTNGVDVDWDSTGFEKVWFPLIDPISGVHMDWDGKLVMDICRLMFNHKNIGFGIAPTSQMKMNKAVKDNF